MTALRGRRPTVPLDMKEVVSGLKGLLKLCRKQATDQRRYVRSMERRYNAALIEIADLKGAHQKSAARTTIRGKGPNVRDVAFTFLQKARGPQPIRKIAVVVLKMKGGRGGANFVQNLGAALMRDRRFKRTSRGVYGLK